MEKEGWRKKVRERRLEKEGWREKVGERRLGLICLLDPRVSLVFVVESFLEVVLPSVRMASGIQESLLICFTLFHTFPHCVIRFCLF